MLNRERTTLGAILLLSLTLPLTASFGSLSDSAVDAKEDTEVSVEQSVETSAPSREVSPMASQSKVKAPGNAPEGKQQDYAIPWWVLAGGGGRSSSETYALGGTLGQTAVGVSENETYRLYSGFWCPALTLGKSGLGAGPQVAEAKDSEADGRTGPQIAGLPRGFLPKVYAVSQNCPNPFTQRTRIDYQIPMTSDRMTNHVILEIHDVTGRVVKTLVDDEKGPGFYSVTWNGKDSSGKKVSTGVYIYRIQAGDFCNTKKAIMIR